MALLPRSPTVWWPVVPDVPLALNDRSRAQPRHPPFPARTVQEQITFSMRYDPGTRSGLGCAWPLAVAVTAGGVIARGRCPWWQLRALRQARHKQMRSFQSLVVGPLWRGKAPRVCIAAGSTAAQADDMGKVLSVVDPALAGVVRVGESSGGGLGLFARRDFSENECIHSWDLDSETVMTPLGKLADKLESGDFGALAFQILKASRSKEPSPWRLWSATGVAAPETHPLKLLLSDPKLAQLLWKSTTRGGSMSAAALQLRDDVEMLQGSATLEEWTEAVALVMSHCIVEDNDETPLLVLGLDLLQDGGDPNVLAKAEYETVGGGPLGMGGPSEERLSGVTLVARRAIRAGDELTGQYFKQPHGGKYIERYGFLPARLSGDLAPGCVELSFAPTDEEDDPHFDQKESILEDEDYTTGPMPFLFSSEERIGSPYDSDDYWEQKSELNKMVNILRLRYTGGAESFLLDTVYVKYIWNNCSFRISKENEAAVCKAIIDECDLWLDRFDSIEDQEKQKDGMVAAAADVRSMEADLLQQLKYVFQQELRDTLMDDTRKYWADRQMDALFPQRRSTASSISAGT